MEPVQGARTFQTSGDAYDGFMGRYSRLLASRFADAAGVSAGQRAIDVGCGPGALTTVLVERLGADAVVACDPSGPFVEACRARNPGVDVQPGRAETIPFDDASADVALAQLVLHFVSDPTAAAREMRRVTRPGGTVGACVWDFAEGMQMLRLFWDSALALDPDAPDEARTLRFGGEGEIAELFTAAGLVDVQESTLEVRSSYNDVDELWRGFLAGIGPAGAYLVAQPADRQAALRRELLGRLGSPTAEFALAATARCAVAHVP